MAVLITPRVFVYSLREITCDGHNNATAAAFFACFCFVFSFYSAFWFFNIVGNLMC